MESHAFMEIADMALSGKIAIVSSDYVKFEVEEILDSMKRKDVKGFERTLSVANIASSERLIVLAREFSVKCGLNSLDALHVSAACIGDTDFLLTCDDEILHEKVCIERVSAGKGYGLKVRNPVNYLKEKPR
jgi:predicted nucleic acid-binding protein